MHSNLMSCKKFKKQCLCHYLQNTNDPWFLRLPVCLDINFLSICKNLHLASQWPHCEALLPGPNSLTLWYSFSRHPAKHSARTEVRIFRYRISQHTPPPEPLSTNLEIPPKRPFSLPECCKQVLLWVHRYFKRLTKNGPFHINDTLMIYKMAILYLK